MEPFFADYLTSIAEAFKDFRKAIRDLPQEALDWVPGEGMNSLVVLVMHTMGAARYWTGDVALQESSNRDRAAEFAAQGVSEAELLARIDEVEAYIRSAAERLTLADLSTMQTSQFHRAHPDSDARKTFSVGWCLLHTLDHTTLHVGHAQITRQLWEQRH
ncbi:MAG: hypothetical protein OHK0046_49100 [Anaerolineae bacterium]